MRLAKRRSATVMERRGEEKREKEKDYHAVDGDELASERTSESTDQSARRGS